MTFEETTNYLRNNLSILENITPSYGLTKEALNILIQKVEYAMKNEDTEVLTAEEGNIVRQFLTQYIEGLILLNFKLTDEIAEASRNLSLLVDNFLNIYVEEKFFDPTGLIIRTLIDEKQSLQAQICLNTYLVQKLQKITMYKDDPLDEILSRKYYEEYINFLNRRKDHDSSYSLNDSQ